MFDPALQVLTGASGAKTARAGHAVVAARIGIAALPVKRSLQAAHANGPCK
jgi:hypothetical protein